MLIFLIILSILILLITWLLVAPIRITINSKENTYTANWKGIASAALYPDFNNFLIRVKVFFWKKEILPFSIKKSKKKGVKKKKEKTKKKGRFSFSLSKALRIIKSWKLKVCNINIDTHDVIGNSYLLPLFYFLQNKQRSLNVNYQGVNRLNIVMENTVGRMLKAFLFN